MTARKAVYAGSFDPIHNGHLDIVDRCSALFDEVVIAVLDNKAKSPLFSGQERTKIIGELLAEKPSRSNCTVQRFSGLLVDFVEAVGAHAVVRGLRAVSDFEYEFQMALMNRHLNPRVETVFMMPHEDYIYLSSRLVKEVFALGGKLDGKIPPLVAERLGKRLRPKRKLYRDGSRETP